MHAWCKGTQACQTTRRPSVFCGIEIAHVSINSTAECDLERLLTEGGRGGGCIHSVSSRLRRNSFSLPSTRFVYGGAGNHLHHRQGTACLYSSVHDAIGTARAQTSACMGNRAACSRATRSSQDEQGCGRASGRASGNSAAQFRNIQPSSKCLPPQRASETER